MTEADLIKIVTLLQQRLTGYYEDSIIEHVDAQVARYLVKVVQGAVAEEVKRLVQGGLSVTVTMKPPEEDTL